MMLERYLRTLWSFLQTVHRGMVIDLPSEKEPRPWYLRLSLSGYWEVTTTPPDALVSALPTDLIIPLVVPLAPIILVAHVETQWAHRQTETNAAVLLSQ